MKNMAIKIICVLLIHANMCVLKANNDYPIKAKRLSPRVVLLTGRLWETNVLVIASNKGMVMVGAPFSKNITQYYMEAAEKEFNRKDFIYLINSSAGIESIGGNSAFKDETKIGHVDITQDIIKGKEDTINKLNSLYEPNRIALCKDQIVHLEKYRDTIPKNSEKFKLINSIIINWQDLQTEYSLDKEFLPPNLTFTDEMNLELGDVTIQLINYGHAHFSSGIFIYIPQESILYTGSVVDKETLPFVSITKETPKTIVTDWISILNRFTNDNIDLKYIIVQNGLSKNMFDKEVLKEYDRYITLLWEQIQQLKKEKKTLEEIKKILQFKTKFKEFSNLQNNLFINTPWEVNNIHEKNIESFWLLLDK